MDTIAALIEEKSQITKRLEKMIYGSVEIRDSGGKKYLYTHFTIGLLFFLIIF